MEQLYTQIEHLNFELRASLMTEKPSFPLVSVVSAWYNRAQYVRDSINSLLNQDFDDFEIIVVNDGSTDPNVQRILEEYDDFRMRVIYQENRGFVNAIRRAIDESRGKYIALQGAGDVSLPSRLRFQTSILNDFPDVGVVGCGYENVIVGGRGNGARIVKKVSLPEPGLRDFLIGNNPISHGEAMFRRTFYNEVGGYREFFKHAQDRDLWIRMASKCKFRILERFLYERRIFNSDGISADRSKTLLQKAMSCFAKQCYYDKLNYGRDYVEIYGINAGLFREKSAEYANFCMRQAWQAFAVENNEDVEILRKISLKEKKTMFVILSYVFIYMAMKSKYIGMFFRSLLLRQKNSYKWFSVNGLRKSE